MISKEELAQCFRDENYEEEQITRVLEGKNKNILARGKKDNIRDILKKLEQLGFEKEKIIGSLTLLIEGTPYTIENIYKTLTRNGISRQAIEDRMIILIRGNREKINKIMPVLERHGITVKQIESCLTVLMENDEKEIDNILKILKKYGIKPTQLDDCMMLIAKGSANEIEEILKKLNSYNLDEETIKVCLKLISNQKGTKIIDILKVLKEHKIKNETIEKVLVHLLKKDPNELNSLLTVLEKHNISPENIEKIAKKKIDPNEFDKILTALTDYGVRKEVIENTLITISESKLEIVKEKIKVLQEDKTYNFKPSDLESCMMILIRNTPEEMRKILKTLKDHNISETAIKGCMRILARGKADNIEKVIEVLERHKINFETCMGILIEGKPDIIEENLTELEKYGITKESISNCLSILIKNDIREIKNILKVLSRHHISTQAVENCLSILSIKNSEAIEEMLTTLEKHGIETKNIESCLSILLELNSKKMEQILTKLEANNVDLNKIKLTNLSDIKVNEIDGITKILKSLGMSIEDNITILSYTTEKRLNEIIRILRNNGVKDDVISKELKGIIGDTKFGIEIEDIFDDDKIPEDKKIQLRNLRRYMRLTGIYGTYYTIEDVEALCTKKHIDITEFLGEMLSPSIDFINLYHNKLINGGRLYIGPTKPIDNTYLEEQSEEIIELSNVAAKKFMRRTIGYDTSDIQSLALEIIVNKCGGLVENLKDNNDALRGTIISTTVKNLYGVAEIASLSITQVHRTKYGSTFISDNEVAQDLNQNAYEDIGQTQLQNTVDFKKAEFDDTETQVMECMMRLIEERRSR